MVIITTMITMILVITISYIIDIIIKIMPSPGKRNNNNNNRGDGGRVTGVTAGVTRGDGTEGGEGEGGEEILADGRALGTRANQMKYRRSSRT